MKVDAIVSGVTLLRISSVTVWIFPSGRFITQYQPKAWLTVG
jgi:hypothetical protein